MQSGRADRPVSLRRIVGIVPPETIQELAIRRPVIGTGARMPEPVRYRVVPSPTHPTFARTEVM